MRLERQKALFGWRGQRMRGGTNLLNLLVLPVGDQPFFFPLGSRVKEWRWFREFGKIGGWTKQKGAVCHCELLPDCISLID